MNRKPLRSDWRTKPPRKMIPAMDRHQLFLMKFRIKTKASEDSVARFANELASAFLAVSPLFIQSVARIVESIGMAISDVAPAAFLRSVSMDGETIMRAHGEEYPVYPWASVDNGVKTHVSRERTTVSKS